MRRTSSWRDIHQLSIAWRCPNEVIWWHQVRLMSHHPLTLPLSSSGISIPSEFSIESDITNKWFNLSHFHVMRCTWSQLEEPKTVTNSLYGTWMKERVKSSCQPAIRQIKSVQMWHSTIAIHWNLWQYMSIVLRSGPSITNQINWNSLIARWVTSRDW